MPYGIRHRVQPDEPDSPRLKWLLLGVAALAAVSFLSVRGCLRNPTKLIAEQVEKTNAEDAPKPTIRTQPPSPVLPNAAAETRPAPVQTPPSVPNAKTPERPNVAPAPSPEAKKVERWLETADSRPVEERALLERLAEAERRRNDAIALDSVKRLLASSVMADLHDALVVRLGQLNAKLLFSDAKTPWTTTREVRPGDNLGRIAREHRTTAASILKLNPQLPDANHLRAGQKLRILDFPDATLVVRAEPRCADLMLRGKLFKRYPLSAAPSAKPGSYPITRELGPRTRFGSLGVKFSGSDAEEAALFLAPASAIVVTAR